MEPQAKRPCTYHWCAAPKQNLAASNIKTSPSVIKKKKKLPEHASANFDTQHWSLPSAPRARLTKVPACTHHICEITQVKSLMSNKSKESHNPNHGIKFPSPRKHAPSSPRNSKAPKEKKKSQYAQHSRARPSPHHKTPDVGELRVPLTCCRRTGKMSHRVTPKQTDAPTTKPSPSTATARLTCPEECLSPEKTGTLLLNGCSKGRPWRRP